MTSIGSPSPFFLAGKKAYSVDRSLRFNDDDSPLLSRTFSSAGNRKTWTYSCWVKRARSDSYQGLLAVGTVDGSEDFFGFDNNILIFRFNVGDDLKTSQVFRDFSAWYHIVVVADTTQSQSSATASDSRLRFYVNGEQVTDFIDTDMPSQNFDFRINNNVLHYIGEYPRINSHLDGYLAEVNFVDGLALDASYFGETNAITGQWNPKKYVGSYGTNGFYLNFADNSGTTATTMGKDSSGNGNNFTPNNFSVSAGAANDSLEDTPTNNFATLNPLDIYGDGIAEQITNGNLEAKNTSSSYRVTGSTFYLTTGKWYYEVKVIAVGSNFLVGVAGSDYAAGSGARRVYNKNGQKYGQSGFGNSYGASFTTNDIIGVAINLDDGELTFYKNGASQGVAFTDLLTGLVGSGWTPIFNGNSNSHAAFNFGQRAFDYTVPTGYKALNSANLPDPTILLPNNHFNTVTYSGSNSNQSITGVGFQPDWVWIKNRSSTPDHMLNDAVRGAGKQINSNTTSAELVRTYFQSFDSDGFSLEGNVSDYNKSGSDFVAWNWNAGDTDGKTYTVTVVDDSGNKFRFDGYGTSAVTLDLAEGGTYIFDQSDSSNAGHPLRFSTTSNGTHGGGSEYTTGVTTAGTPGQSGAYTQIVVAASAPTLYYYCSVHSGMGGQVNTNSTLGSSNFDGSIQSTVKVNATAGLSIVTYTRNGSSITVGHGLGVAPNIYLRKRRDSTDNWIAYNTILDGSMDYLVLNATDAKVDSGLTVPTSTKFYDDGSGNMVVYAFSEVAGYSKFGSYTGNGNSDGTFVFTGFRPAWVLIKRSSASGNNWEVRDIKRDPFNPVDNRLYPNTTDADGNEKDIDFVSNGFKIRTTASGCNTSGSTYIYLAFAESPFKNARAR